MYKTNLSWNALMQYLDLLLLSGYVQLTNRKSKKTYSLTEEGREILSDFQRGLKRMNFVVTTLANRERELNVVKY